MEALQLNRQDFYRAPAPAVDSQVALSPISSRSHVLQVHEKRRDFKCEFCEFAAGTKGILKTHVKNRHLRLDKDLYDCHLCPYKAVRKSHLKEHMKSEHR